MGYYCRKYSKAMTKQDRTKHNCFNDDPKYKKKGRRNRRCRYLTNI